MCESYFLEKCGHSSFVEKYAKDEFYKILLQIINQKVRTKMEKEFNEYVTFHVTAKDGSDVEMAVMDEFEYDHKQYVVGAVVEGDTILEDGLYIYRSIINGDDFTVEKIEKEDEYRKVAEAYMEMDD